MTEVGEPSHAREEEIQDKHVVHEEIPAAVEPEADPEEDPEEADELGGDSDGPLSPTSDSDLLQELHERNLELQTRVQELEAQAAERQESLEQHEMAVEILATRNLELKEQLSQSEHQMVESVAEKQELMSQLDEETARRIAKEDALTRASRRVDCVEREVRAKKVKVDDVKYACWSAFGRAQDRVLRHPVEYGQSRHTMSRGLVVDIMSEEYYDSVRRGELP